MYIDFIHSINIYVFCLFLNQYLQFTHLIVLRSNHNYFANIAIQPAKKKDMTNSIKIKHLFFSSTLIFSIYKKCTRFLQHHSDILYECILIVIRPLLVLVFACFVSLRGLFPLLGLVYFTFSVCGFLFSQVFWKAFQSFQSIIV